METNETSLSAEELSALREASVVEPSEEQAPEERAARVRVMEYNFRQPGQLSATQLRALNTVHELFSKKISSQCLGGIDAELTRLTVDTISYSNFIASLNNPCFVAQLTCGESETVLLDLDLPVARSLAMSMLGSSGDDEAGRAPLSSIEQSLAGGWIEKTLPILTEAWAMSTPVQFDFKTIETDPRFIQVMPDETPVVVMSFLLAAGSASGQFSVCYPLALLQPMLEGLALRMTGEDQAAADADNHGERLLSALKKVPFNMHAELGRSTLLANQLIRLQVGDVICLDRTIGDSLDLYLGPRRVFRARMGRVGDQLAVQVTGRCSNED